MDAVVVGSGPAGLASIKALLRCNVRVTLLDVGEFLDPDRLALVADLSSHEPDAWSPDAVRRLTDNQTIQGALPRKLAFGSDFIYAKDGEFWPMDLEDIQARGTFARGGFSTVWGGAMLPADDCDMIDWPIRRADLASSYKQVLSDLPLSAGQDDLREAFPLYKDKLGPLKLPRQAQELLQDLQVASKRGRGNRSFIAGQARLAVHAWSESNNHCRYCGMCLSSCPYESIYSTASEIRRLSDADKIEYLDGIFVDRLEEDRKGVTVYFTEVKTGLGATRRFDKAYVGAGAMHTTRIILDSLRLYDTPVEMLDSQKFLLPLIRLKSTPLAWPNLNTLASLFLETKIESLSDHWIHLQISMVNDLILRKLGVDVALRRPKIPWWIKPGIMRLLVAWCNLHSDHSARIELRLSSHKRAGRHVLQAREISNPSVRPAVSQIAWKLARLGLPARLLFLPPLARLSAVGTSGHYGGTFPMSHRNNGTFASDALGRPQGMKRVHLVDATIFPSIPGTTMVLPIMANANRIVLNSTGKA